MIFAETLLSLGRQITYTKEVGDFTESCKGFRAEILRSPRLTGRVRPAQACDD
jgi:hypothetical protein